jgi:hypothetical protein
LHNQKTGSIYKIEPAEGVITDICDVELSHKFPKIAQGCLDKQVKMVSHEDVTEKVDSINL